MRASIIPETGDPEVVTVSDVPKSEVGSDNMLVDVKASAVNHIDVWIRRGYEGDPPVVTGIDVAGEIADVGAEVKQFTLRSEVTTKVPRW